MSFTKVDVTPVTPVGKVDPFWYAQGDPWHLKQDRWDPERAVYFETIFSLANGYMGFRGYREEVDNVHPSIREGYLAGTFAKLPPVARQLVLHDYEWESRQMVSLPVIFGALIRLNGELFNISNGEINAYSQVLDLRRSVLEREIDWTSGDGRRTRLKFSRFLSASIPNLAVHRIEIEPVDWSGEAGIWWDYDLTERTVFRCGDPARANLDCPAVELLESDSAGDTVLGLVRTLGTGHEIAFASRVSGPSVESRHDNGPVLSQESRISLVAGKNVVVHRYTVIASSRDEGVGDPSGKADEVIKIAFHAGYDTLEADHAAIWNERWEASDIEIDGPERDQVLVRFGIYSLLQVAPFHGGNHSIPARCYAFNRYNGLYFWDGEIFLLPFYQFCMPEVARSLLQFRCRTLPGARATAKLLGAVGAAFPWQGDADSGKEQAPWGLYAYLWHQTADIVYAFDQYARSSGDEMFMCGDGLEVLAETARFWASRFYMGEDGKYHLDGTVGPDEAEEHGPDNGYTCLLARRNLKISTRWWRIAKDRFPKATSRTAASLGLNEDEILNWEAIAQLVSIPEVPGEPGVPLQDAFFLKRKEEDISTMTVAEFWERRSEVQVIKQADIILATYLLEDDFGLEEIRRGYEFYEPRTLHVSSLSYNTHAIVAAIIGKHEQAYDYFRKAAGLDLDNLRDATRDGLHAAALGAVWQMAIPGFMGLRAREDHLYLKPCLPKAWKCMEFPIQYRGWKLRIRAGSKHFRVEVSGRGMDDSRICFGKTVIELDGRAVYEGRY